MFRPKRNFSAEEDDKLIEAVAAHPSVYDLKHFHFKDQRIKEEIWEVVAEEVGRSVGDCKKRWNNIKDTYDRKNRETRRNGWAPPFKKAKTWALQEKLSFLPTLSDEYDSTDEESLDDATDSELDENAAPPQKRRRAFFTRQPQATSSAGSGTYRSKSSEKKLNYCEKMYFAFEKKAKELAGAMVKEFLLLSKEEEPAGITPFQTIAKTKRQFPPLLQRRAFSLPDLYSQHPADMKNIF